MSVIYMYVYIYTHNTDYCSCIVYYFCKNVAMQVHSNHVDVLLQCQKIAQEDVDNLIVKQGMEHLLYMQYENMYYTHTGK